MSTELSPRYTIKLDDIEYKHYCLQCSGYIKMIEPHGNNTEVQHNKGTLKLKPTENSE